jgi:hypothetical protein
MDRSSNRISTAIFAVAATLAVSVTALAVETPTIERGDWGSNVRVFAETNLKHPAWGFAFVA